MINWESLSELEIIVITLLYTRKCQNEHPDAMEDFLSCLVKFCNFFPPVTSLWRVQQEKKNLLRLQQWCKSTEILPVKNTNLYVQVSLRKTLKMFPRLYLCLASSVWRYTKVFPRSLLLGQEVNEAVHLQQEGKQRQTKELSQTDLIL